VSPRSEYFEAVYASGRGARDALDFGAVAAVSFALCFAVFAAGLIAAWLKSASGAAAAAALPLNGDTDAEAYHE
jgi:hypothetical protein